MQNTEKSQNSFWKTKKGCYQANKKMKREFGERIQGTFPLDSRNSLEKKRIMLKKIKEIAYLLSHFNQKNNLLNWVLCI